MNIRRAQPSDLETIYHFICLLEEYDLPFSSFSTGFLHNLSQPGIRYYIGEIDRVPVAMISLHTQFLLHHSAFVYEIQELFVLREHRTRGLGRQLIKFVVDLVKSEGGKLLEVASNNKRLHAHDFYLACEFKQTHKKFTMHL